MPTSKEVPSQIAGYVVFPLTLPPLPSYPVKATHYLYIGQHNPKLPTSTSSKSLFLVNIPIDATEAHLKRLFSVQLSLPAGRIDDIQFEEKRKRLTACFSTQALSKATKHKRKRKRVSDVVASEDVDGAALPSVWDRDLHVEDRTCVVTFVDRACMEAAFKAVKSVGKRRIDPIWGEGLEAEVPPLGSARYAQHQRLTYPDKAILLDSVDTYMTAFAAREAAQEEARARQRMEPDEDGFVTVTKGSKSNPATQRAAQASAEKQKEKQKGLQDFYHFQARDKKKAWANDLLKKFEKDREKINQMKKRRVDLTPA